MLPEDAVVIFLSHRWLQPGNPDDKVLPSPQNQNEEQ